MDLQKACDILEELSDKDIQGGKLTFEEYHALQMVLLELQSQKKHVL